MLKIIGLIIILFVWHPLVLSAGSPVIDNMVVTDVTPTSFSVIWRASEASSPGLNVYSNEDGSASVVNIEIKAHPVYCGNQNIVLTAENNGVMKMQVTGLSPDTTYYYQTITTSKSTDDTVLYPASAPFPNLITPTNLIRSVLSGEIRIPFTNDTLIVESLLPDGITPADGTLVVVQLEDGLYPITSFVGDCIPEPFSLIDLNNLFDTAYYETNRLNGDERIVITKFMGIYGLEIKEKYIPLNNNLAEIKEPSDVSLCTWDSDTDKDVDGADLAGFADDYILYQAYLDDFAGDFGRTDCR